MSDGFYDDWIASDDTSDHHDPIQAHLEGQLEELERERESDCPPASTNFQQHTQAY